MENGHENSTCLCTCVYIQGSIHASLTSSSKMAAISSAMLAAAASEEEESAESILERHMSQCSVFSGPDTHNPIIACHSASGSSITQHHGARLSSGGHHPDHCTAHHAHSSSLTHSRSAVEGSWSLSDHRSSSDYPPTFRTSASFGDADSDLRQPLCWQYISELTRADCERTVLPATSNVITSVSRHHQQRPLMSCPHTDANRK